jgi:hypothetical protein
MGVGRVGAGIGAAAAEGGGGDGTGAEGAGGSEDAADAAESSAGPWCEIPQPMTPSVAIMATVAASPTATATSGRDRVEPEGETVFDAGSSVLDGGPSWVGRSARSSEVGSIAAAASDGAFILMVAGARQSGDVGGTAGTMARGSVVPVGTALPRTGAGVGGAGAALRVEAARSTGPKGDASVGTSLPSAPLTSTIGAATTALGSAPRTTSVGPEDCGSVGAAEGGFASARVLAASVTA